VEKALQRQKIPTIEAIEEAAACADGSHLRRALEAGRIKMRWWVNTRGKG